MLAESSDKFIESLRQKRKEEEKQNKKSFFKHKHKSLSASDKLEKKIMEMKQLGLEDMEGIMTAVKNDWQQSHGKVIIQIIFPFFLKKKKKNNELTHWQIFHCFQKICGTLESHKAVFELFPSESPYTATLCGAFSMVIQVVSGDFGSPDHR